MSLYEALALVALVGAGGYAYTLYRSDTRAKPPGSEADKAEDTTGQLMFKRTPQDRPGRSDKIVPSSSRDGSA
jgi:hypothetical protein